MPEFSGFIPGIPKPQPRPRCTIRNVRGKPTPFIYSPTTPWRKHVEKWIRHNYTAEPLEGPLRMTMFFTVPPLKTVKRLAPTGKAEGDIDNLVKAVMDALNETLWVDDGQVVELDTHKHYPRTNEECGVAISVTKIES